MYSSAPSDGANGSAYAAAERAGDRPPGLTTTHRTRIKSQSDPRFSVSGRAISLRWWSDEREERVRLVGQVCARHDAHAEGIGAAGKLRVVVGSVVQETVSPGEPLRDEREQRIELCGFVAAPVDQAFDVREGLAVEVA